MTDSTEAEKALDKATYIHDKNSHWCCYRGNNKGHIINNKGHYD